MGKGGSGDYYIFPGGGQDHGELLSQTVIREISEETGFLVHVGDIRRIFIKWKFALERLWQTKDIGRPLFRTKTKPG